MSDVGPALQAFANLAHDAQVCAPYLLPMQHDLRLWQAIAAGEAALMLLAVGFVVWFGRRLKLR